jgi:hypothetical protein
MWSWNPSPFPKPVLSVLRTKDPQDPAEPTGGSSTPQSTIHFTPGTEARPTKIHQDTEAMLKCDVSKKTPEDHQYHIQTDHVNDIIMYIYTHIIFRYIWVNYNISLTWNKAILGMISLTNHDFQWGRSEVVIIYPDTTHQVCNVIYRLIVWWWLEDVWCPARSL